MKQKYFKDSRASNVCSIFSVKLSMSTLGRTLRERRLNPVLNFSIVVQCGVGWFADYATMHYLERKIIFEFFFVNNNQATLYSYFWNCQTLL